MQFPGRSLRTLTCITDRTLYSRYVFNVSNHYMQSWHVCLSECTLCISHITCIECIHDDILRDGIIDDLMASRNRFVKYFDSNQNRTMIRAKTHKWAKSTSIINLIILIVTAVCARLFYKQMKLRQNTWKFKILWKFFSEQSFKFLHNNQM